MKYYMIIVQQMTMLKVLHIKTVCNPLQELK